MAIKKPLTPEQVEAIRQEKLDAIRYHLTRTYQPLRHAVNRLHELELTELETEVKRINTELDGIYSRIQALRGY